MIDVQCVIARLFYEPMATRDTVGNAVRNMPAGALIVRVLKLGYPTFLVLHSHDTMSR
jgi:hypothetical protein